MRVERTLLVVGVALAFLLAPLVVEAQQAGKVYRIGALSSGPDSGTDPIRTAFLEALAAAGYQEGRNVALEYRFANGDRARLPKLAAELVSLRVDVILASLGTAPVARAATQSIPIVFITSDPVEEGLVQSLARPGGNATGLAVMGREVVWKSQELLKEALPGLRRLAVFSERPIDAPARRRMEERAKGLGLELHILAVRGPDDIEAAFKEAQRWGAGAVSVMPSVLTYLYRSPIASAAMTARLPTVGWFRAFAEAGALMTYAPDEREMLRRGASYVDRILKGAKPADLPVEQPTKFEFVINMKTAKALGVTIPRTVLVQADKVIR